jgi:hypothetical protein
MYTPFSRGMEKISALFPAVGRRAQSGATVSFNLRQLVSLRIISFDLLDAKVLITIGARYAAVAGIRGFKSRPRKNRSDEQSVKGSYP